MNQKIKNAMIHPDVLHAGASKRKSLSQKDDVEAVMAEFKRGTLRAGSGEHVTNPKQAKAIALSESKRFAKLNKMMGKKKGLY